MKVLAQYDEWYLIETSDDVGRVFDRARSRLYGPLSLASLYAKRRWLPFTGDDRTIKDEMSLAEHVGSAENQQPLREDADASTSVRS